MTVQNPALVSIALERSESRNPNQPGTREEKVAVLRPLVDRLCTSHHWRDHRHVRRPFGAAELNAHVTGGHKYGLCPIAPGESTCRVALLDFDSHDGATSWEEMLRIAGLVAFDLEQDGYAPILWRSSGGNGIHLYLLWDDSQEAYSVRAMLNAALARCGLKSGTRGVAAREVEVFAKQNGVPADGWGSMFVLPLCGKSELLT